MEDRFEARTAVGRVFFHISSARAFLAMRRRTLAIALAPVWLLCSAFFAQAGVVVFDDAAALGVPVLLRVQTRGRFFPDGGRRVSLTIEGRRLRTVLTGADGFGYARHAFSRTGLIEVHARFGDETAVGRVRVVSPADRVVLVAAGRVLTRDERPIEVDPMATEAIEKIAARFGLVYLAAWPGPLLTEKWLSAAGLPRAPVIAGPIRPALERLAANGVAVYALVGPTEVLEAASGRVPHRIGFEETGAGTVVQDWSKVPERLQTLPAAP